MPALFFSGYTIGDLRKDPVMIKSNQLTTHRLLSIHAIHKKFAEEWLSAICDQQNVSHIEVMFDSGAFTAWKKQEPDIKVQNLLRDYLDLDSRYGQKFKALWFINLDKIPGTPGASPSAEDIKDALRVSDENFKVLREGLGLRVLPVFHMTESTERLHETVSMNPTYICLSPRQGIANKERTAWAQRVHIELAQVHSNSPTTHGLGATGEEMMLNVPWRSVDSSAWGYSATYGMIMVPRESGSMASIAVSAESPHRRDWGKHLDSLGRPDLLHIKDLASSLGMSLEDLRTSQSARMLFNMNSLQLTSGRLHRPVPVQTTLLEL